MTDLKKLSFKTQVLKIETPNSSPSISSLASKSSYHTLEDIITTLNKILTGYAPLTIIFYQAESFNPKILSDFIQLIHASQENLPVTLILCIQSILVNFKSQLSSNTLSKISIEKITLEPASNFFNTILDDLFYSKIEDTVLNTFYLTPGLFRCVSDMFLTTDFSSSQFYSAVKLIACFHALGLQESSLEAAVKSDGFENFKIKHQVFYQGAKTLMEFAFPHMGKNLRSVLGVIESEKNLDDCSRYGQLISDLKNSSLDKLKQVTEKLIVTIEENFDFLLSNESPSELEEKYQQKLLKFTEELMKLYEFMSDFDQSNEEMLEYLGISGDENKENQVVAAAASPVIRNNSRVKNTKQLQKALLLKKKDSTLTTGQASISVFGSLRHAAVSYIRTIFRWMTEGLRDEEVICDAVYAKEGDELVKSLFVNVKKSVGSGLKKGNEMGDMQTFFESFNFFSG